MKIGILTYYGDLNFGTNLQAYATLQAVRSLYPNDDVEIVPMHSFRNRNIPYKTDATFMSLYRDLVRIHKFNQFRRNYLGVNNDYVIKDPKEGRSFIGMRNYDIIYVGADTLLELDRIVKAGKDGLTAYWLGPEIKAKQYILAASSKHATYGTLTALQREEFHKSVPCYSGIFVRDTPTQRLMANAVPMECVKLIPDPTFTLNIDYKAVENYVKKRKLDFSNTVCIHGLKDDSFIPPFVKILKEHGFQVASIRPAKWADIELNDMGPMEHAGIFKYFKCLITQRFHDSVFSLKNGTPVVSYLPDPSYADTFGESKYSSLFDLFGLTEYCVYNDRRQIDPSDLYEKVINCMSIWDKQKNKIVLDNLKEKYLMYLRQTK